MDINNLITEQITSCSAWHSAGGERHDGSLLLRVLTLLRASLKIAWSGMHAHVWKSNTIQTAKNGA